MRFIGKLFFFILFLLVVAFVILNAQMVSLNYYIGQISVPAPILILVSFVVGGFVGLSFSCISRCCKRSKVKKESE